MITDLLRAIDSTLPGHIFILLPGRDNPELTLYTAEYKATVRTDDELPVYVVTRRDTGKLITWGEGRDSADAMEQALAVLANTTQQPYRAA